MFTIRSSHSLAVPVASRKVVKIQPLNRLSDARQQRLEKQALSVKKAADGEYIAASQACDVDAREPLRILSVQMGSAFKQLNFYQQHQDLIGSANSSLGLNIDCLL